jgi:hypothetical protein
MALPNTQPRRITKEKAAAASAECARGGHLHSRCRRSQSISAFNTFTAMLTVIKAVGIAVKSNPLQAFIKLESFEKADPLRRNRPCSGKRVSRALPMPTTWLPAPESKCDRQLAPRIPVLVTKRRGRNFGC